MTFDPKKQTETNPDTLKAIKAYGDVLSELSKSIDRHEETLSLAKERFKEIAELTDAADKITQDKYGPAVADDI